MKNLLIGMFSAALLLQGATNYKIVARYPVPNDGGFDYVAKYLAKSTQEICPGRFAPETTDEIKDQALRAHQALSCVGYSRSDFIVSDKGPIYLETNTLPGLTKASLYPKALKAQGIEFADFLHDQIKLAAQRARK